MEREVGVPVSWNQLGDSNWYEVETSTKYTYYYNRETKESSWEKPELGRAEKEPEKAAVEEPVEEEVTREAVDEYKELIRSLELASAASYEQCIPRLLFDPRYKRVPQPHRKRLFNQIRRELMEERASTHTLPSLEELRREQDGPEKRRLSEPARPREKHRRRGEARREVDRGTHLRQAAENDFLSLLHEKVKMPFSEGRVAPLPAELLLSDPRFHSEHLEDRESLYRRFVREFLDARLQLFEGRLRNLDSIELGLDEVVEALGTRLFGQLPREDLERILKRWREEKKSELVESFRAMLRESLCYREGKASDNLELAKLKFAQDERFARLESFPEERDRLIAERLEELERMRRESRGAAAAEEEE